MAIFTEVSMATLGFYSHLFPSKLLVQLFKNLCQYDNKMPNVLFPMIQVLHTCPRYSGK